MLEHNTDSCSVPAGVVAPAPPSSPAPITGANRLTDVPVGPYATLPTARFIQVVAQAGATINGVSVLAGTYVFGSLEAFNPYPAVVTVTGPATVQEQD